jgi:hypothetical protein
MLLPTDGPVKEMLANLSHLPGRLRAAHGTGYPRRMGKRRGERVVKATLAPAAPLDRRFRERRGLGGGALSVEALFRGSGRWFTRSRA